MGDDCWRFQKGASEDEVVVGMIGSQSTAGGGFEERGMAMSEMKSCLSELVSLSEEFALCSQDTAR